MMLQCIRKIIHLCHAYRTVVIQDSHDICRYSRIYGGIQPGFLIRQSCKHGGMAAGGAAAQEKVFPVQMVICRMQAHKPDCISGILDRCREMGNPGMPVLDHRYDIAAGSQSCIMRAALIYVLLPPGGTLHEHKAWMQLFRLVSGIWL